MSLKFYRPRGRDVVTFYKLPNFTVLQCPNLYNERKVVPHYRRVDGVISLKHFQSCPDQKLIITSDHDSHLNYILNKCIVI